MFEKDTKKAIKKNAVNASTLAMQLAQDRKFRKRLLSALKHSSAARHRTRSGLGVTGAIARLASDQALQSELRSARNDLQRAYRQLDAKRRTHKLRRFALLAGLASLAAVPQVRERLSSLIRTAPTRRQELTDIVNRVRPTDSGSGPSRPTVLEDLSREELYQRAQEAGIPGRSEMSKQELVEALRAKS